MELIPVVDLIGGKAVAAVQGQRHRYVPLRTALCRSHHPLDVITAYLDIASFTTLYIADLDAIAGNDPQLATLAGIASGFPALRIWLDAGRATGAALASLKRPDASPVIGSESYHDWESLKSALTRHRNVILSFDFMCGKLRGPEILMRHTQAWPERLIVMTLDRIGTGGGADIARLQGIRALAGSRSVFAAGGVRSKTDLEQLAALGLSGVLLASALHSGAITTQDIREFRK